MAREQRTGKKYVDLHVHSTFSDGAISIRGLLEMAAQRNLRAISITDHDCIDGYPEAYELGASLGVEVISGVELSGEIEGADIHILGYFVDIHHPALIKKLQEMKDARFVRAQRIVENLNKQGIDLRFDTVLNIAGEGAIGRPHIASAMLKEELVYSFREAFDKHIGYECPAYVGKLVLSPKEVFSLILDAGGVPVLAHPGVTGVDNRILSFVSEGLQGIEVYHSEHSVSVKNHYMRYCQKHNLVCTGGSDFHSNTQTKAEIGVPRVPYSLVEGLRERHESILKKGSPT